MRRAHAGSDTLLIFLLKGAKPDKYRDRQVIELKLEDWDGDFRKLSASSMKKIVEQLAQPAVAQMLDELIREGRIKLPEPGQVIDAKSEPVK